MRAWSVDIKRALVMFALCTLVAWMFGSAAVVFSIGLLGLLLHQSYALWKLYRWFTVRGAPLPQGTGMLGHIEQRMVRSERQSKKRKKRLRRVVQRFQQSAEANPDGALILGGDNNIEWLNKAAGRFLGLHQGQDHGQPLGNFIRNPGFAIWLEDQQPQEPFELDAPHRSELRLLIRVIPYSDAKRMLIVRDITRLHKLEQMRRDFVANVSHELRSPLTVLVGYLEGMRSDDAMPESQHRAVLRMSEQSERMSHIVEDLLRLSRIESDPGGAAKVAIDMSDLIAAIIVDSQRLSKQDHRFEVNAQPGVLLLGDYNEMYSALSNLVFNAMQYSPDGGPIYLTWGAHEKGSRFEVKDVGLGIEEQHLSRLTERFYRVDKARSRELGGTGLGLAIVKHVLMRHDSTLQISSEIGKGSVFACEFPAHRAKIEPQTVSLRLVDDVDDKSPSASDSSA